MLKSDKNKFSFENTSFKSVINSFGGGNTDVKNEFIGTKCRAFLTSPATTNSFLSTLRFDENINIVTSSDFRRTEGDGDFSEVERRKNEILSVDQLSNIIIYGPPASGKYTHSINIIKRFSPSVLKYHNKIAFQNDKICFSFSISDIHYEIDISLLGCNSKIVFFKCFLYSK